MNFNFFGVLVCASMVLIDARPQVKIECKRREVGPGSWKFTCEPEGGSGGDGGAGAGADEEDGAGTGSESGSSSSGGSGKAPTINLEHVLWIQQGGGEGSTVDVEIPNYKIDEVIKAGFKGSSGGSTKVNILLKKPQLNYNAEVDTPKASGGQPSVNVQYEAADPILVHYPTDKEYRPVSAPIVPPRAADAAGAADADGAGASADADADGADGAGADDAADE